MMTKQATRKFSDEFELGEESDTLPKDSELPVIDDQEPYSEAFSLPVEIEIAAATTPPMTEPHTFNSEHDLGTVLSQKRESKGLHVRDVAEKLRLEERVIRALENNNYEKLPPTIFVQGYLRNYAKLLELPVEDVLAQYKQQAMPETPSLYSKVVEQKQVGSNSSLFKLMTLIILIGLPVLSGLWYYSTQITPETPTEFEKVPALTEGETLNPSTSTSLLTPTSSQTQADHDAYVPPSEAAQNDETGGTDNTSAESALSNGTATANSNGAVVGGVEEEDETPAANTVAEGGTNAEDSAAPAAVAANQLRLKMGGDSWIQITDSTGKAVFAGVAKKDQEIELEASAPVKIILGRPHEVQMFYAGKSIDLSQYHNRVARFTLER